MVKELLFDNKMEHDDNKAVNLKRTSAHKYSLSSSEKSCDLFNEHNVWRKTNEDVLHNDGMTSDE